MTFTDAERGRLERARVGRLATADDRGRPSVVPFCFAIHQGELVSALDEKPKGRNPRDIRRVRDIDANPHVAVVVDEYAADWSRLWWVQVRGQGRLVDTGEEGHAAGVDALRAKYGQYDDHAIESRPLIRIAPGHVRSWGLD